MRVLVSGFSLAIVVAESGIIRDIEYSRPNDHLAP